MFLPRIGYFLERWAVTDIWLNIEGGANLFFGRMASHISIVLEQKTFVFQNIGGGGTAECETNPFNVWIHLLLNINKDPLL